MRTAAYLTFTRANRKAGHSRARVILIVELKPFRSARFQGGRAGEALFTYGLIQLSTLSLAAYITYHRKRPFQSGQENTHVVRSRTQQTVKETDDEHTRAKLLSRCRHLNRSRADAAVPTVPAGPGDVLSIPPSQPWDRRPKASSAAAEPAQQTAETCSAAVPDEPRITIDLECREKVVCKMSHRQGRVCNRSRRRYADGSVVCKGGKDKLTGLWTWEDHYCRTAKIGTKDFGHDCQTVEVSGDVVTFTRKKGKGKKSVWKIESGS